MDKEYAVKTYNLYKSYGKKAVIANCNMGIKKGRIYCLVDQNGAGKTTLFKILLGLTSSTQGKSTVMVAIPRIDPGDSDAKLFSSYNFVISLSFVVLMGIFSIISATMASRYIVDEYSGKKAILLLSYPISRKKILKTKILLVFIFSFVAMFIGGIVVLIIFMITESLVPISADNVSIELVLTNIAYLVGNAINASFCGIVSGWIGLKKQSAITTIVASVIIMVIMCQITAMTFFSGLVMLGLVFVMTVVTLLAAKDMLRYIENLEI